MTFTGTTSPDNGPVLIVEALTTQLLMYGWEPRDDALISNSPSTGISILAAFNSEKCPSKEKTGESLTGAFQHPLVHIEISALDVYFMIHDISRAYASLRQTPEKKGQPTPTSNLTTAKRSLKKQHWFSNRQVSQLHSTTGCPGR